MIKDKFFLCLLFLFALTFCFSQKLYFKKIGFENPEFKNNLLKLNKEVINIYTDKDSLKYLDNSFRFQMINGEYDKALNTINKVRSFYEVSYPYYSKIIGIQFELYLLSKKKANIAKFEDAYKTVLKEKYKELPIESKVLISNFFKYKEGYNKNEIYKILKDSIINDSISLKNAMLLCRHYNYYNLLKETFYIAKPFLKKVDEEEFLVKDSIILKTKKGSEISLYYVLNKKIKGSQPSILQFSTYLGNDEDYISESKVNASKGYNIIYAHSRGIYLSKDDVTPFEFEVDDVNEVISWIIKQPWSNGKIGMFGGSYNGFSQWAATKRLHPALKTIIPSASVGFGIDFPMENNVFNTYMIRWLDYVLKSRYSYYDDSNNEKWKKLVNNFYKNGLAFKKLDSLNGSTNPIFQKWLKHPSFDKFWQSKLPYKRDFKKINIPVLTFTGYFDDDQLGAMYYYKSHYKYNKNPNHYLVIGPYDHYGSQGNIKENVRGYIIDPIAKINIKDISFQWFDYILKGKKKPEFLKDKVNYQVMGSNQWKSAPSIKKISNKSLKLYLNKTKLQELKPDLDYLSQQIDFSNRKDTLQNFERYKLVDTIINSRILKDKLVFESEAFNRALEINGSFVGNMKISINKKDIDISILLYELKADGQYCFLSSYLGRASHAKNNDKRQLLNPYKIEEIPIHNSYFVSKKIEAGSKIKAIIGVNKDPYCQINYGTGKDVSEETIADAKEPLEIKWYNDSYIEIPVTKE